MFADQQGSLVERGRPAIGQVIAQSGGAHDGEFAAPVINQFISPPFQTQLTLGQQTLNRIQGEVWMVGRQTPINVKVTLGIYRNNALNSGRSAQGNAAMREINLGMSEVEI